VRRSKGIAGRRYRAQRHPDAVWALRIRVHPTPDTYVESGVYEVNQGLLNAGADRFRAPFLILCDVLGRQEGL